MCVRVHEYLSTKEMGLKEACKLGLGEIKKALRYAPAFSTSFCGKKGGGGVDV